MLKCWIGPPAWGWGRAEMAKTRDLGRALLLGQISVANSSGEWEFTLHMGSVFLSLSITLLRLLANSLCVELMAYVPAGMVSVIRGR